MRDVRGGHREMRYAPNAYISREEAMELAGTPDIDALCDGADYISTKLVGRNVDSCSIVNARSGLCGENCKWCAQAVRHHTGCNTYEHLDDESILAAGRVNAREGIRRFSLVTSGRALSDADVDRFCETYRKLTAETGLYLCASMGLLTEAQLQRLAAAA